MRYIDFDVMIAKRCPNGSHRKGKNCYRLDENGKMTDEVVCEAGLPDSFGSGSDVVASRKDNGFTKVKPDSEAGRLVSNLRYGRSDEAIASRKALVDWAKEHGDTIPYVPVGRFKLNGKRFGKNVSSKDLYFREGRYSSRRTELHQQLTREVTKNLSRPTDRRPIIVVMAGGTASGKSSASKEIAESLGLTLPDRKSSETESEYRMRVKDEMKDTLRDYTLDSDEIVPMLPEFDDYMKKDPLNAWHVFHKEASDIMDDAIEYGIADGSDFVLQGTFSSDGAVQYAEYLAEKGTHDMIMIFVDTPSEKAMEYNYDRFVNGYGDGENDRIVPPSVVRATNEGARDIFTNRGKRLDKIFKKRIHIVSE